MTYSYAVDVSGNQPAHQDWKAFGVHMGIAKASEGQRTRDPWFVRHIADIKAAGLVRGGYHFAWPNQGAGTEADNYIAAVKPYAGAGFVHILDLEPYPDSRNYVGRTDAQIRAYATAWVSYVKTAFPGQRVLCYTPGGNYSRHFPAGSDGYWYPAYPVQGRSFAGAAALPRPAGVAGGAGVWGWQFTSVPRDQTVIYMDPAALRSWSGIKTVPSTPSTPVPEVPVTAQEVWNYKIPVSAEAGATAMEAARLLRGTSANVTYLNTLVHQVISNQAATDSAVKALAALLGTGSDVDTIVARVTEAIKNTKVQVTVVGVPAETESTDVQ